MKKETIYQIPYEIVSANSPANTAYKLGEKAYSRRHGTYNAMWLDSEGSPAYWGSYNPDDGSFYLSTPDGTLANGMWIEQGDGDYVFHSCGTYSFDDVRRALQLGVFM